MSKTVKDTRSRGFAPVSRWVGHGVDAEVTAVPIQAPD